MLENAIINVNGDTVQALDISLMLVVITLLPTMVVMMTSFTRYVISFSFLRTAMGTQQTPPNLVLVGMALILTLFTMSPVIDDITSSAYEPYRDGTITQEEFFDRAQDPLKRFMLRNTEVQSLELFCSMSGVEGPASEEELEQSIELPLRVIVPAFVTSELKEAFWIGFLLYIPFMLIDVIVSSTLMSMGMIMLPPAMISTPFKLLLFILLDGWQLLFSTLIRTVN
ncbi:MAG: flagellar type III secretion system pore protein FliP [Oscillospiraceae bacterium]|nr:flagellar type III secretion system pore protein FliP [Oscillospiraceae bacterium]